MEASNRFNTSNSSNSGISEKLLHAAEEKVSSFTTVKEVHHCPYKDCTFSSTWKASLNNHIKTHTDERPWQCALCNKHFRLKHHLKHHILTHSQNKPFKCNLCEYRCHDVHSLQRHKVNKHKFPSKRKALSKVLSLPTIESLPTTSNRGTASNQFLNPMLPATQNTNLHASSSTPPLSDSLIPTVSTPLRLPSNNLSAISNALMQRQQNILSSNLEKLKNRRRSENNALFLEQKRSDRDLVIAMPDDSEGQNDQPSIVSIESVTTKESPKILQSYWNLSRPSSQKSSESRERGRSSVDSIKSCTSSDPHRRLSECYADHLPVFEAASRIQHRQSVDIFDGERSEMQSPDNDTWKCVHCSITFPDNIMYGLHMGCHSVGHPFQCNICGKKCANRHDFMFHFSIGKHSFK